MFGYVTVDPKVLTPEQRARFQACYCGLCRCLRREYGLKGQLTLSFDMTFLLLTLSSLYEPAEKSGEERCGPAPAQEAPVGGKRVHRLRGGHEHRPRLSQTDGRLGRRARPSAPRRGRGIKARLPPRGGALGRKVRRHRSGRARAWPDREAPRNGRGRPPPSALAGSWASCSSTAATSGKSPCAPWANTSAASSTSWTPTTT